MRRKVMDVKRLKEAWIIGELSAPDIPTACAVLGEVTQSIERRLRESRKRDPKTLVLTRRIVQRAELLAYFRLRREQVHAV